MLNFSIPPADLRRFNWELLAAVMGFCLLLYSVLCVLKGGRNGALTSCVIKLILVRLCNIVIGWDSDRGQLDEWKISKYYYYKNIRKRFAITREMIISRCISCVPISCVNNCCFSDLKLSQGCISLCKALTETKGLQALGTKFPCHSSIHSLLYCWLQDQACHDICRTKIKIIIIKGYINIIHIHIGKTNFL